MKDLIIVGAGGFGCEIVDLVESINKNMPQWNILGFIDDTKDIGTEVFHGYRILGGIQNWIPTSNEFYSLGISSPQGKFKLYNLLKSKGAIFATLISPTVHIPSEMKIGEGCTITLGWFGINVNLGICVNIHGSMVGEAEIGDFSTTTGFTNIAGAKLGKRVFVGSHAVVLNNVSVGDDAFICAGSIVFSKVKSGTKVWGNPAKKIDL